MALLPRRAVGALAMTVLAAVAVLGGCAQSPPRAATPTWPSGDPFPLVDASTTSGPYLPWDLVRVDRQLNRVYLTVSNQGCTIPQSLAISETPTTVTLAAVGAAQGEPCTAEARALTGYVQLPTALGDRQVLHGQS